MARIVRNAENPSGWTTGLGRNFALCLIILGGSTLKKLTLFASLAAVLITTGASAATNLVTNGSFEATSLTGKGEFNGHVTGWTGGTGLTFLDYPGTATSSSGGFAVYPGFPSVSPDGGNFIQADGDPSFSGAFSQTINGLIVDKVYTLNFDQAAGQQNTFKGPTTERWKVTFGNSTQLSSLFSLDQGATGPWETQSMTFTATSVSQILTFLAVGTPKNAPPVSFLDGVSLVDAVPEPATWGMMIVGLGAMGAAARLRRRQAIATA